jgi:hypothetical protein
MTLELKSAVSPEGVAADRDTLPMNPFSAATVIVDS